MSRNFKSALLAFGALFMVASAQAADMIPYPPPPPPPPALPPLPPMEHPKHPTEEKFGSWYLRGDLGVSLAQTPSVSYDPLHMTFFDVDAGAAWNVGGGIGYRLKDNFRIDLTADFHSDRKVKSRGPCSGTCSPSMEEARLRSITVLGNAYLEFGDFHYLRPYVGIGAGVSATRTSIHTGDNDPFGSVDNTFSTNWNWNPALAAMAGASFVLTDTIELDAGYRALWVGNAKTGTDPAGSFAGGVDYETLINHDFRLGMRFNIH